jgi:hypothetical protein
MSNFKGMNGIERDIAKLKNRWGPWRVAMTPHFKRFAKKPSPHNYTNLCVESSRADAYVNGKIMAVSTGLVIVTLVCVLLW